MNPTNDLSWIKKQLIQLRPIEDVCALIVEFLNQQLNSIKTGIFIWDEKTASFQIWPRNIIRLTQLRVYDPFLLFMTENDQLYFRSDIDDPEFYRKSPAVAVDARRIFLESNARLLVPLVLNQSLIGLIFVSDATNEIKSEQNQILIKEIASLAVMALSNSILYNRLEGILSNLEEKVQERTRELQEAQSQLVQKEKMAMLGVMVAGIAHEVNTPASVIQGSAKNIDKNLFTLLGKLRQVEKILEPKKLRTFMMIVKAMGFKVSSQKKSGIVKEAFKRKKELYEFFQKHNIKSGKDIAALFVENSLYGTENNSDLDKFVKSPIIKNLKNILEGLNDNQENVVMSIIIEVSNTARNLKNIHYSIRNIIRIIRALKHYSHLDQGEMSYNDINHSIENTLVIMNSILKGEINIEKNYGMIPEIICNPDELSQIWTNLITNSKQAMKNTPNPRILISTFTEKKDNEECIVVEIEDNGPGIPDHLHSKIWDPFFTTKDQGEGSGLGLGIVRGIIEKHKAQIMLKKSDPSGTLFRIEFPLNQNE